MQIWQILYLKIYCLLHSSNVSSANLLLEFVQRPLPLAPLLLFTLFLLKLFLEPAWILTRERQNNWVTERTPASSQTHRAPLRSLAAGSVWCLQRPAAGAPVSPPAPAPPPPADAAPPAASSAGGASPRGAWAPAAGAALLWLFWCAGSGLGAAAVAPALSAVFGVSSRPPDAQTSPCAAPPRPRPPPAAPRLRHAALAAAPAPYASTLSIYRWPGAQSTTTPAIRVNFVKLRCMHHHKSAFHWCMVC